MNPARSSTRTKPISPPRRVRALIASAAGAGLILGALAPLAAAPAVGQVTAPTSGLLAEYVFDETAGSSVPNSAVGPIGAATVMNGSDSLWTGSSLVFTGGAKTSPTASWVRLPDNLLAGKTSATVTIETKLDASMKNNWNFLWNIGSDSTTQYYFASVRDNPRTTITTGGGGGEVNARSGTALSADRWYSLTSVIDGAAGTITFYVDGEQVARTATALTPASITDQTLNAIGRAPYPDPMYKGEVSTFRVYDRALTAAEVDQVSDADASVHASSFEQAAQTVLDGVTPVTIDEQRTTLPDYGGRVAWTSADPALEVAADGVTVSATQPATGSAPVTTALTATATVRGASVSKSLPVTIKPLPGEDDAFGYAMVHFIEDSAGYAEKIYLDVSRGDNPEHWDPLNGGKPILASQLGTTGIRDPYLTYNPENGTYYIIATDLRVFGGDRGVTGCTEWCYWSSQGSTKLNVWESKDLVTWSDLRQFDVAQSPAGTEVAELGMAWAPEATWVPGYNEDGSGAFVVYWSSNVYANAGHTGSTYSRILWGATTDFTQDTYEYGGVFIDAGGNTIDTTIIQDDGKTYRITKDNSAGKGIYMESTPAADWWAPTATWTQIQTRIGAVWSGGNAGGVEGPAVFQRHGEDKWYLYVDVIPSTGYRPMQATDLDAGWAQLVSSSFSMAPSTKHGGIVPLTSGQYETIREADATGAVASDLGSVDVESGATADAVRTALPGEAEVTLAYGRGTASQPVAWDVADVDTDVAGTYEVTGVVQTIGANLNQWVGAGGSTAYNAPDRKLFSSTAITVTAEVVVAAAPLPVTVTTATRCVAGKVVLTVTTANDGDAPVALAITTAHGSKTVAAVQPGKTTSAAFTTRLAAIPSGSAAVAVSAGGDSAEESAPFAAASCG
ncbi:LamG-like jellyroll fold domain-containing protein [Microbacterium trichothecenolyticum]|uniref:Glycosyl hydrolases family 43 n=1 Tax=Microbacterium trichothecenolyticum TaxID=69370 RepID=A0A0M2HH77_MICTR|nr:LamG-like jellyroll fold domain-containing protein [Microbacterium trichothecenolyticum]KJL43655.1 Glycosyl hydrolases family 43 [Microbacterium trichothecenolyticum]